MITVPELSAAPAAPATVRARVTPPRDQRAARVLRRLRARPLTSLAIAGSMLFVAGFGIVGADTYWLVALGDHIARTGSVPEGVPFAAADTSDWPNVLVLAQLVFAALGLGGPGLLLAAQVLALGLTGIGLTLGARRLGARDASTAGVVLVAVAGSLMPLGIVRLQLLSLVPFALLLLLLRAEHARPSRRIWLLLPLLAVWSNLHGAVLMGTAVAGCYLLFSRLRRLPAQTMAVGLGALLALLATPALLDTIPYYLGVFGNEAAQRGSDLWARPDLGHPLDVLMVLAAVVLLALAARRRLPLWEWVAIAGLAGATATGARHGIWLLLLLAARAAAGSRRRVVEHASTSQPLTLRVAAVLQVTALVVAAGSLALAGLRSDAAAPYGHHLAAEITRLADGRVVLAPEPLAESLAAQGATVWAADPVDAFSSVDQAAFLDFLTDGPTAGRAINASAVVVVQAGGPTERAAQRIPGLHQLASLDGFRVLVASP